jgi:hypothetical protein
MGSARREQKDAALPSLSLTNEQAPTLSVSPRKANQIWAYAKAWLLESLGHEPF